LDTRERLAEEERTAAAIVDSAYRIHSSLGPGLLESVYEALLVKALLRREVAAERQKLVSFEADGLLFADALRFDLLVNGLVVVELKSVEAIAPIHIKQLLTYLRVSRLRLGLLINFGATTFKSGVCRVVNSRYDRPLLPID
jgi:iron complex transport system substrate-binding protein